MHNNYIHTYQLLKSNFFKVKKMTYFVWIFDSLVFLLFVIAFIIFASTINDVYYDLDGNISYYAGQVKNPTAFFSLIFIAVFLN
ncbi:hypothetical protein ACW95P_02470 [Candidatus Mycoplasma pogonae]